MLISSLLDSRRYRDRCFVYNFILAVGFKGMLVCCVEKQSNINQINGITDIRQNICQIMQILNSVYAILCREGRTIRNAILTR